MAKWAHAAIAAATLTGVCVLTGCSSRGDCATSRAEGRHAVLVGSGIPASATGEICAGTICSSAVATRSDQIEVPVDARLPSPVSTVTANVSAGSGRIAAPVTTTITASPTTSTAADRCAVVVDYRYTVTVSPTR